MEDLSSFFSTHSLGSTNSSAIAASGILGAATCCEGTSFSLVLQTLGVSAPLPSNQPTAGSNIAAIPGQTEAEVVGFPEIVQFDIPSDTIVESVVDSQLSLVPQAGKSTTQNPVDSSGASLETLIQLTQAGPATEVSTVKIANIEVATDDSSELDLPDTSSAPSVPDQWSLEELSIQHTVVITSNGYACCSGPDRVESIGQKPVRHQLQTSGNDFNQQEVLETSTILASASVVGLQLSATDHSADDLGVIYGLPDPALNTIVTQFTSFNESALPELNNQTVLLPENTPVPVTTATTDQKVNSASAQLGAAIAVPVSSNNGRTGDTANLQTPLASVPESSQGTVQPETVVQQPANPDIADTQTPTVTLEGESEVQPSPIAQSGSIAASAGTTSAPLSDGTPQQDVSFAENTQSSAAGQPDQIPDTEAAPLSQTTDLPERNSPISRRTSPAMAIEKSDASPQETIFRTEDAAPNFADVKPPSTSLEGDLPYQPAGIGVSVESTSSASTASPVSQPLTTQVLTALVRSTSTVTQNSPEHLTLRLDPPELGELEVEFRRSDDGVTIRVTAREPVTMEMLMSRGGEIEKILKSQDPEVLKVEMVSSDSNESGSLTSNAGSGGSSKHGHKREPPGFGMEQPSVSLPAGRNQSRTAPPRKLNGGRIRIRA